MTDFDTTDPWGSKSPWEIAQPDTNTAPEAPVNNPTTPVATSPDSFEIGMTLKAAGGFEAEWLTPRISGATAEQAAKNAKDLLLAMKGQGLIEFVSQAAQYTRGQYLGNGPKQPASAPAAQPFFQNGQVQYGNQAPSSGAEGMARPADVPGHFTYKEGNKNGKSWKGWFPPRGSDEAPIWL